MQNLRKKLEMRNAELSKLVKGAGGYSNSIWNHLKLPSVILNTEKVLGEYFFERTSVCVLCKCYLHDSLLPIG